MGSKIATHRASGYRGKGDEMTTATIKSITTVRATGAGNNGNWVIKMTQSDGSVLFGGVGAGYTLAQAQQFAQNNRQNRAMNDPFTGVSGRLPYRVLPAGVTIAEK